MIAQLVRCVSEAEAGVSTCEGNVSAVPLILFSLIFLWGSRLTYNFWRKDGYSLKGEDYRWVCDFD
jgi:steroid 5-alpha reductase family enzyme